MLKKEENHPLVAASVALKAEDSTMALLMF